MTDNDRFDRELSERLRAHEERVPGSVAPRLTDAAARRGWAPLALVGAAGLVVGAVLVGVLLQRPQPPTGEGTPSPSASASLGDPRRGADPSAGDRRDAAALHGRTARRDTRARRDRRGRGGDGGSAA